MRIRPEFALRPGRQPMLGIAGRSGLVRKSFYWLAAVGMIQGAVATGQAVVVDWTSPESIPQPNCCRHSPGG